MTIEERLTKLERMNRRLMLAIMSVVCICGMIVVAGASKDASGIIQEAVVAKSILVTEDGTSGILLSNNTIQICDEKDRRRFVVTKEGLGMYGEDEELKANLLVKGDDVHFTLRNDKTKRRTSMLAWGETNGFVVFDKDGRPVKDLTTD